MHMEYTDRSLQGFEILHASRLKQPTNTSHISPHRRSAFESESDWSSASSTSPTSGSVEPPQRPSGGHSETLAWRRLLWWVLVIRDRYMDRNI